MNSRPAAAAARFVLGGCGAGCGGGLPLTDLPEERVHDFASLVALGGLVPLVMLGGVAPVALGGLAPQRAAGLARAMRLANRTPDAQVC